VNLPDTLGPVVGVRAWRVRRSGLWSATAVERWGGKRARCRPWIVGPGYGHEAPRERCTCGYYLLRDEALALCRGPYWRGICLFMDTVLGRARGWGKVIPHERGWRCEYAAPVELFRLWNPELESRMQGVARRYRVPIVEPPPDVAKTVADWQAKMLAYWVDAGWAPTPTPVPRVRWQGGPE
jgi:hypothetical protein